jgi:trans-aconitate methyltransferase
MISNLDNYTSQYKANAVTALENNLVLNWYPKRILNRIKDKSTEKLLELGLGHGYTTLFFNNYVSEHVVIEGSQEVVSLFKAKYDLPNLKILEDYFETFESREKFDIIVMGFVLEHVNDPLFIVQKYIRMLAPNGRLFIAVPNAKSLNRRLGVALGKIQDIYELNENDHLLGHKRQFCLDTLKDMLKQSGCNVTWQEGIYLKPLPINILKELPDCEANLRAMCAVGVDFPELCVGLLVEAVPVS